MVTIPGGSLVIGKGNGEIIVPKLLIITQADVNVPNVVNKFVNQNNQNYDHRYYKQFS